MYNDHKVKPLHILLSKTGAYVKVMMMDKLIEDDDLLEKYNTIWDKGRVDIKKEFDSEPMYDKNF